MAIKEQSPTFHTSRKLFDAMNETKGTHNDNENKAYNLDDPEHEPTTYLSFKSIKVSQDVTSLANEIFYLESKYQQIPTFLEISKDHTPFKSFQVVRNQELNPSQAKHFYFPTENENIASASDNHVTNRNAVYEDLYLPLL